MELAQVVGDGEGQHLARALADREPVRRLEGQGHDRAGGIVAEAGVIGSAADEAEAMVEDVGLKLDGLLREVQAETSIATQKQRRA